VPEPEHILKLKRIISPIARAAGLDLRMPLPVWDTTGTLIGVAMSYDKQMGPMACRGEATFVITAADQLDHDKVKAKAELAVAALQNEVLVSIRPKKSA
jgi:hypothetical protein